MKIKFLLIILIVVFAGCNKSINPPIAKKVEHIHHYHDSEIKDNYHWMKDKTRSNKEVLNYIEQENNYTSKMMKHTKKLQDKIYKEIISRIEETDNSLPYKKGDY